MSVTVIVRRNDEAIFLGNEIASSFLLAMTESCKNVTFIKYILFCEVFICANNTVYIITNKINTVLYTGVTNNLQRRIFEHKQKLVEG